jgi:hypothetical protein
MKKEILGCEVCGTGPVAVVWLPISAYHSTEVSTVWNTHIQNVELLVVTLCGTYSYHWALKG